MQLNMAFSALPWDSLAKKKAPHVEKLRERALEVFSAYQAKWVKVNVGPFEYERLEMHVPWDDPGVEVLIRQFDQEVKRAKPAAAALLDCILEPEEERRARFLELHFAGGSGGS